MTFTISVEAELNTGYEHSKESATVELWNSSRKPGRRDPRDSEHGDRLPLRQSVDEPFAAEASRRQT